jgi:quercetin dioxygenase-like cupin family protein
MRKIEEDIASLFAVGKGGSGRLTRTDRHRGASRPAAATRKIDNLEDIRPAIPRGAGRAYGAPMIRCTWEAIMQFRTTGLLLFGAMALPASGAAQTTAAPPAITRTVIAATKLPTVTDVPVHFKAVSITLQPDERGTVSAANGILYQMSGSAEVALDGEAKMLYAGEGLFIAGGKTAALTAGSGGPSTFLHFFLAPAANLDRAVETPPAVTRELYRTASPIPDLKPGSYDLNLTRVTFPAQMPSNPPHHRSGAALYFIISGTGANTVDGKTEARGPGSLIYEPYGLVHQWGNRGNEPLIFLAFNINPEGVAAVLPGAPAKNQ